MSSGETHVTLCLVIVTRAREKKHFLEWESTTKPVAFAVTRLCPCATNGLNILILYYSGEDLSIKVELDQKIQTNNDHMQLHAFQVLFENIIVLDTLSRFNIHETIEIRDTNCSQFNIFIFFQLHVVSRTHQGKQREPSVKTLRSPQPVDYNCGIQHNLKKY